VAFRRAPPNLFGQNEFTSTTACASLRVSSLMPPAERPQFHEAAAQRQREQPACAKTANGGGGG
jgi:hypothetical protein